MKFLKVFSPSILSVILLIGCSNGTMVEGGKGGNHPIPPNSNNSTLVFDDMTEVPVVNGNATSGKIYIHNYSNSDVSKISYSLSVSANINSSTKGIAHRNSSSNDLVDDNGFIVSNPSNCSTIKANSFCALDIITPKLDPGHGNNVMITMNYSSSNGDPQSIAKIINYRYYDASSFKGVNFTTGGSVTALGAQGSTRHVVGYIVGGGTGSYQNIRLIPSESNLVKIANGFSNNSEVAGGQAIAVEFVTQLSGSISTSVNVTPYAFEKLTSLESQSKKKTSKNSQNATEELIGSSLIINLIPSFAAPHLDFGNIPIIDMTKQNSTIIHVVNTGNAAANGFSVLTNNESAVSISNNCNAIIEPNTSCSILFTINDMVPNSATINYSLAGTTVGSDVISWVNESMIPVIDISVTPTEVNLFTKESLTVFFTISNVGRAELTDASFNYQFDALANMTTLKIDCASDPNNSGKYVIPVNGVCHVVAKLTSLSATGDGLASMSIDGRSVITSYNFDSASLIYHVFDSPTLSISPSGEVNLVANAADGSVATQIYTINNSGNTQVNIGPFSLNSVVASEHQPIIDNDSSSLINPCLSITNLLPQQSCELRVKYGPWNSTNSESGSMNLIIGYGADDFNASYQKLIRYSLINTNNEVTLNLAVSNLSGNGSQQIPYLGSGAITAKQSLILTYSNPTSSVMPHFNINTNALPLGLDVDSSSTCPTGGNVATLAAASSCMLVLTINQENLARVYGPLNGGELIMYPSVSWVTGAGVYKQAAVADQNNAVGIYLQYKQATITPYLNPSSGNAESVALKFTVTNAEGYSSPFYINVSGVSGLLQDAPIGSGGCVINSDFSANCDLFGSDPQVTYLMPDYLSAGSSVTIPLELNLSGGRYAYLSNSYIAIHYTQVN